MNSVTVTYSGQPFAVDERSAALAFAFTQLCGITGKSLLRHLELVDGSRAAVFLGPGCPISFFAADEAAFEKAVAGVMPEVAQIFSEAPS